MSDISHKVKLWGQLKHLTGQEFVEVAGSQNIDELVLKLAEQENSIAHFLLAGDKPNPSILIFVNDNQHMWGTEKALSGTESVTIMSPIAGG
ncbi:MAG: MoaD/ThiS family protein [Lentisphaerales bacterium]|nr:MoaD/ThiS family protein [Lentisphaerales bacterium]